MNKTMKALVRDADGVGVRDRRRPEIQSDGDVIIRVMVAGLCRTDVYAAQGKIPCKDDLVLGHEFAGEITAAGAAAANDFKTGDRVTVMPVLPCGKCDHCAAGRQSACPHSTMIGIDHDGAFAEYVRVPAEAVYKVPDTIPFRAAAYSEPIAASAAVLKAGIEPHERGLIYGDNRISQLTWKLLKAAGFDNVDVYDHSERDAKPLAENHYDFIVETLATTEAMEDITRAVRPQGRIILKSRKYDPVGIDIGTAVKKEINLVAVNYGDFQQGLDLLADGRLNVDDLLGEVFPLEAFGEVFENSQKSETRKCFFTAVSEDVWNR